MVELVLNMLSPVPPSVKAAPSGPVLLGTYPVDDAVNVPMNSNLSMTFDENVSRGTGSASISVRRVSDNRIVRSISAASGNEISINGNVVTISLPSGTLEAGGDYYVLVDAGAFQNSNGANFAGIANATAWNFSVVSADSSAPLITSMNPASGSVAPIDTPLELVFNKTVFASAGYITLQNENTGDVQSISVTSSNVQGSGSSNRTVRVTLPSQLAAGNKYNVTIDNNAFVDLYGKGTAAVSGWSFTTSAPPMAMPSFSPAHKEIGVAVNAPLTMSFNTPMAKGSGSIEIRRISDNRVFQTISVSSTNVQVSASLVTISHSNFDANTGYYVVIDSGAFRSADGSTNFQGISDASTWSFTTVDTQNPTVKTFSPSRGSTATALDTKLEITFDKEVYPRTGNVVIRNASNDTVFASIPVTSDLVTGGGTSKIIINPGKQFVDNSSYYVQIGNQAFADGSGNNYTGINDKTTWSFKVNKDTSAPYIVTYSPVNNATNVSTSPTMFITFNKPIQRGDGVIIIRRSGTSSSFSTTATVDTTDNKKLNIKPSSSLINGVSYYVEIPSGAVTDLAGNKFAGIQNEFQWTFKTGVDTTTPQLSKAEMSGSTKIVLTYSKTLNAAYVPSISNFYVTVNDVSRDISGISINDNQVTLSISNGVIYGQTVKFSYSKGTIPLQDLAGNQVSNVTNYTVTNSSETTLPKPTSGTVYNNTVVVNFSEGLSAMTSVQEAYNQFSVFVGGSQRSIKNVVAGGMAATITLDSIVSENASVYVNYTPNSYALRDYYGNAVQAFSNFYVRNPFDRQPPELQTVTVNSNKLTLTYNKGLSTSSVPTASQFAVLVNQQARGITNVEVNNTQVILTLSSSVSTNQTVLVSYVIGYPPITDLSGNQAPSFTNQAATHSEGAGLLTGAYAQGQSITLTFSQALNSSYVPAVSQFNVRVQGVYTAVSSVTVSGSNVVLQLPKAINTGDTVLVSYTGSSGTLRTATGTTVGSFTDYKVSNGSSGGNSNEGSVNLPAGMERAAAGGINMKDSLATTSLDMTPANRAASRYTIQTDKLQAAYDAILSGSGIAPRVQFTVPTSEQAAIVAVSLGQLESVQKQISNASFAVSYREMMYEIPLSSLDFKALAGQAGASAANSQLVIRIDATATISSSSSLMSAINRSPGQLMTSAAYFQLSVLGNGTETTVDTLSDYATYTIAAKIQFDANKTSTVWLDPETGKLSYVPTQVKTSNGASSVSFKRRAGGGSYAVISGSASFTDTGKHWAGRDINAMTAKYITEGRTATKYEPEKPVTRAEFAMFIARGLGLSGDKAAGAKFKDVNASSPMAPYIGAASKADIVKGNPDGTFKPNDLITRQEMAVMIIRAAAVAGVKIDLSGSTASYFTAYKDRSSIASWARDSLAKTVEAGIIAGLKKDTMGPKANATRAQAAIIIKRMLVYINFLDA
ncbi:Ig-like domain-containing protein [Paenibacillus sp. GCM10012307]